MPAWNESADPEVLMRVRKQLEKTLAEIDQQLAKKTGDVASAKPTAAKGRSGRHGRPVRALVLDCLEDLGWACYTREITLYSRARFGREIAPTRFGSLAKDEESSFRAGTSRPVWLCYTLMHDRPLPIKRLLARSDWPLERRVIAPTSGRVQHLKITTRLCELALTAEETASDSEMLRIIAADHARDLPGVKVQRGQFHLEQWRATAFELLSQLEPRDEELRRASAARLADLAPSHQLFGVPDLVDLEPGKGSEVVGA